MKRTLLLVLPVLLLAGCGHGTPHFVVESVNSHCVTDKYEEGNGCILSQCRNVPNSIVTKMCGTYTITQFSK